MRSLGVANPKLSRTRLVLVLFMGGALVTCSRSMKGTHIDKVHDIKKDARDVLLVHICTTDHTASSGAGHGATDEGTADDCDTAFDDCAGHGGRIERSQQLLPNGAYDKSSASGLSEVNCNSLHPSK